MTNIKINSVYANDYKGLSDREIHFAPTGTTLITGANGIGKTTVLELMYYVLFKKDINNGQSKHEPLTPDNKIKEQYNQVTKLSLEVDGLNYDFERVVVKGTTKKLTINGDVYPTEKDYQAKVVELVGEEKEFFTLTNYLFLLNQNTNDARKVFVDLIPPVEKQIVLEKFNASETIVSPVFAQEILTKSATQIIQNFEGELANAKTKETQIGAKITVREENIKAMANAETTDFTQLDLEKSGLQKQIQEAAEINQRASNESLNKSKNENLIKELNTKIANSSSSYTIEKAAHDNQITIVKNAIAKLESQKAEKVAEYHKANAPINENCNHCGSILPEEKKQILIDGQQAKVNAIVSEGKDISAEIAKGNAKLAELEAKVIVDNSAADIQSWKEQIAAAELEIAKPVTQSVDIIALTNRVMEIDKVKSAQTQIENEKVSLKVEQDNLEKVQNEITNFNTIIENAKKFLSLEAELLVEDINKDLGEYSIKLFNLQKNGNLKEVFTFLKNGVDYSRLSTAEKINAGIMAAKTIQKLKGVCLPIIVDCFESNNTIIAHEGQIVGAKVTAEKTMSTITL